MELIRLLPLFFSAGLIVSACGLPRDASGTLDYITGGTMRVGVVANPPWVIDNGDSVGGVEGQLASEIARVIGARIEWVRKPEFDLIRDLHKREVHLVIGGFDAKVPWAAEVAMTRPYVESPTGIARVLAAPPGENAWLVFLERHITSHREELRAAVSMVAE